MKERVRTISKLLIFFIMASIFALPQDSMAKIYHPGEISYIDRFLTNNRTKENDYINVKTLSEKELSIYIKTYIPTKKFRFAFGKKNLSHSGENGFYMSGNSIVNAKHGVDKKGKKFYYAKYIANIDETTRGPLPDNVYHIFISRSNDEESNVFNEGNVISRHIPIIVENGEVNLFRYKDVLDENLRQRKKFNRMNPKLWLDPTLSDTPFYFAEENHSSQLASLAKEVSDKIVAGAKNSYDKIKKIYEFLGENYYYDVRANVTNSNFVRDPFLNLNNLLNKNNSYMNAENGKVAIVCTSFSALVLALARAQGIPARNMGGRHISTTRKGKDNYWGNTQDITRRNHRWSEVYVNGRWVVVDANVSTLSKWTYTHDHEPRHWNHWGLQNYGGFDPTNEWMAVNYVVQHTHKGSTNPAYSSEKAEMNKLLEFFRKKDEKGIMNGEKLSAGYNEKEINSWINIKDNNGEDRFRGDGYGRLEKINLKGLDLVGDLSLTKFKGLKDVDISDNRISGIDVSDSNRIINLNAVNTAITEVDISNLKGKLQADFTGCKLKDISVYSESTISNINAEKSGEFSVVINRNKENFVELYMPWSINGRSLIGIFDSNGNNVSNQSSYTFAPFGDYVIKYEEPYIENTASISKKKK